MYQMFNKDSELHRFINIGLHNADNEILSWQESAILNVSIYVDYCIN